jgi:hypothetical protein
MSAAAMLDRLQRVKQTGPGRWIACCPAHEDRSPSLSIRELGDGRILIHDFGGCDVGDVLGSIGLTLANLFPARLSGGGPAGGYAPSHSRIPARDLLMIMSEEVSVICITASEMLDRKTLTEADWERLATAASRIHQARNHIDGR